MLSRLFFVIGVFFGIIFMKASAADNYVVKGNIRYELDHRNGSASVNESGGFDGKEVRFERELRVGKNIYTVTKITYFLSENVEVVYIPQTVKFIESGAFQDCRNIKVFHLPYNAPIGWFTRQASFQKTRFRRFEFDGEPENFIQLGNILYSKDKRTIYDVRIYDDYYIMPESVDSLYIASEQWPSPYHIVLHKSAKFLYFHPSASDDSFYGYKRLYLAPSIDEDATSAFQILANEKVSCFCVFELQQKSFKSLYDRLRKRLLKCRQGVQDKIFRPEIDFEFTEGVKRLKIDAIYSVYSDFNNISYTLEKSQKKEIPFFVPIRITAETKKGYQVVGYVYGTDTIVGSSCVVPFCLEGKKFKAIIRKGDEYVEGFDYRLSGDSKELFHWYVRDERHDMRGIPLFAYTRKIAKDALFLESKCKELLLPSKIEELSSNIFRENVRLKTLGFPASIEKIAPDAFAKLGSVETLYFQGQPPLPATVLDAVFARKKVSKIIVDSEHLSFWKDKLKDSPNLSKLCGVEKIVRIFNKNPDAVTVHVQRLDKDIPEVVLDKETLSLELPRTVPVRISTEALESFDIQNLVVNGEDQDRNTYATYLLADLAITGKGETIKFQLNNSGTRGGKLVIYNLSQQGKEIVESSVQLLRGTKLRITPQVETPYLFSNWSYNGVRTTSLDTTFEIRHNLELFATFYREKPLLDVEDVDARCQMEFRDNQDNLLRLEELCIGDVVFLQKPRVPDGFSLSTIVLNGRSVSSFPYEFVVGNTLTLAASVIPMSYSIVLSERAKKYLTVLNMQDAQLQLSSPLPSRTIFRLRFSHRPWERLRNLRINGRDYTDFDFSQQFTLDKDLQIDVDVETLYRYLTLRFPPSCMVKVNGEEITTSPAKLRNKLGAALNLRAESGSFYEVTGFRINGGNPRLEEELVLSLDEDLDVEVLGVPRTAGLVYESTGEGKLSVYTEKGVLLSTNSRVTCGEKLRIEVLPSQGNECKQLFINGVEVAPESLTHVVEGNLKIRAVFQSYTYELVDGIYVNRNRREIVGCLPSLKKLQIDFEEDYTIVGNAFNGNLQLETLDIKAGVVSIGEKAFASSGLRMLHLSSSIKKIARNAFTGSPLHLISLEHREPDDLSVASDAFKPNSRVILRVPNGSVPLYKNHSLFSKFKVVEESISCFLLGSFPEDSKSLVVERREYWEDEGELYDLKLGENQIHGGTRLYFKRLPELRDSIVELKVDGRVVRLPYELVVTEPVEISVTVVVSESDRDSKSKKKNKGTSVQQKDFSSEIVLYPNPVLNKLHIETENTIPISYQIISSLGIVMQQGELFQVNELDVSSLQSGVYFIRLWNKESLFLRHFIKY